jgi:hypothetical protein
VYRTLFELAGPAIVAWLMIVLFPKWRVSRRIGESAVFPAYLSVLYAIGVVMVLRESGAGWMREFGSADGVLRLLQSESIALVAWIHILAFDQIVGLLIYRDNMRHRIVPLPVQSAILLLTLLLGPIGFISYWVLRMISSRSGRVAWGDRDDTPLVDPPVASRLADVTSATTVGGTVRDLMLRNPPVVYIGLIALAFAAACAGVAAVNGGWHLGPEGRLLEAAKFDVAFAFYAFTIAAILPLAGFSDRRRTTFVRVFVAMVAFSLLVENVQSWRGLNPRFSRVAGVPDQILGGIFFLSALVIFWLFIDLISTFFRRTSLTDHPLLRDALRFASAATVLAFSVGIVMSLVGSRMVAGSGNLMPIHAAGFHALQAVPLVALLLRRTSLGAAGARAVVRLAGTGWLLLCVGLVVQAAMGDSPLSPGLGSGMAVAGALLWLSALGVAWIRRQAAAPTRATGAVA